MSVKELYETLKIGDFVTLRYPGECYYSEYAGAPTVFVEAGEVGVVGALRSPCVRRSTNYKQECVCVDFVKIFPHYDRQVIWRAGVDYRDINVLSPSSLSLSNEIDKAIIEYSLDIHHFLCKYGAKKLGQLVEFHGHSLGAEEFIYCLHEHLLED